MTVQKSLSHLLVAPSPLSRNGLALRSLCNWGGTACNLVCAGGSSWLSLGASAGLLT